MVKYTDIIYNIFKRLPTILKYYSYKVYFYKYKVSRRGNDVILYWNGYKIIFPIGYTPVVETLGMQIYDGRNVDKVLDVGGGVGDSAIYFVYRGARSVVVYEPDENIHYYLIRNIRKNNLEKNST